MRCIHILAAFIGVLLVFVPARAADKDTGVRLDKEKRTVTIDAKIAPRKLDDPKFEGKTWPVEVVACWAYPKGQKAHETVVSIDCKPSDVHKAIESLGLKPGKPAKAEGQVPEGPEVKIYLEIPGDDGRGRRVPLERTMIDPKTNKPLPKSVRWRFTGSAMVQPDPEKPEKVYGADRTGTLIAIFPVTDETVFQTNLTLKEEKYLKLETNPEVVPKVGTAVKLVIEVPSRS
ncbi:MAG TPA: YdjY domain-containing protein [Gemmataceae bacterium]|nr:YdjY domain-containing protein [Gemmataceae bacterium]